MTLTEAQRHRIYESFTSSYGDGVASDIMSLYPPVEWTDVATKSDLRTLSAELRTEFPTELRTEMAGVRTEIADTRGELRAEISQAIAGQTRWIVGYITTWSGVVLALARRLF